MKAKSILLKRVQLLWACGLTVLTLGCRMGSTINRVEPTPSAPTAIVAVATVTIPEDEPDADEPDTTASSMTEPPSFTATAATATSLPTPAVTAAAATPIVEATTPPRATIPTSPTPTRAAQAGVDFDPILAFKGTTTGEGFDEVALYDTATEELTVIAEGIETEMFNAPLWSPQGDVVAFVQSDTLIGLYHHGEHALELFETAPSNPPIGLESKVGVLLGGFSYDGDWLAYQYIYDSFFGESYLLNRRTGESSLLNFPEPLEWLEWSPNALRIAGASLEFVYVDEAPTLTGTANLEDMAQYHCEGHYIRLITWHPEQNGLLVSTSKDDVLEFFNYLWYLDLDSGQWTFIGKYPSIIDMTYSPDSAEIAISTTNHVSKDDQLIVVDAESFETVAEIKLPQGPVFFSVEWSEADTVVLNAGHNLYVLLTREPEQAYWVLDPDDNPLLEVYLRVLGMDW